MILLCLLLLHLLPTRTGSHFLSPTTITSTLPQTLISPPPHLIILTLLTSLSFKLSPQPQVLPLSQSKQGFVLCLLSFKSLCELGQTNFVFHCTQTSFLPFLIKQNSFYLFRRCCISNPLLIFICFTFLLCVDESNQI